MLAGCSSDGGDWSSLVGAARVAWEGGANAVNIDQAAAIPFATLGLRLDQGQEQILILATDDDGVRLWTAPGHVSLVTQDGRILRTAGLGTDLTARSTVQRGDEDWTHRHRYDWTADFNDLGQYSIAIRCDVAPEGADSIEILGKTFETIRIAESCESSSMDWRFENTYWVSPESGRVWRSIQHVHPKGPVLEVEYLRPPAGDR